MPHSRSASMITRPPDTLARASVGADMVMQDEDKENMNGGRYDRADPDFINFCSFCCSMRPKRQA